MLKKIDNFFKISALESSFRTEILAGCSTFAAMAYIICVQPALLSGQLSGIPTGMPMGALLTTTCLASAAGCFMMGIFANYPIGLAPGIGSNFFFVFSLIGSCAAVTGAPAGSPQAWQTALAVILCSGILFLAVSFTPLRKCVVESLSPSIKGGIVAGIGLFVIYLGMKNGQIINIVNGTPSFAVSFRSPACITFFISLLTITVLMKRKVQGAILYGIFAAGIAAYLGGILHLDGIAGLPANPEPVMLKVDMRSIFIHFFQLLPLIFICFFVDMFDTMGTVLGVASNAGLIKDGKVPRLEKVFVADAAATVTGALLGHGTVTSFVESSAGAEAGGKTGFTAIVIGVLFLLSLIFTPLISAIGSCPAITSGALVAVGCLMLQAVREVAWNDISEVIPAILIMGGIPFAGSIIGGISLGLILYPVIKVCSGKYKETGLFSWITALLLGLYISLLNN